MPSCSTALVEWFRKENMTKVSINEFSLFPKKLKTQSTTKLHQKSVFAFDPYSWNYSYQNSAHIFRLLTTRMTDKQQRNETNSGYWQMNLPAASCDLPWKVTCLRLGDGERVGSTMAA